MNYIGYFKSTDKRIDSIKYANWGSRPYEYQWVIDVINELNITNMKVIDLGIGEPSLHGWPNFFKDYFKYDLYVGIDCNDMLKREGIDTENFKLKHMDMTDIDYANDFFNLGICISTFEHFDSLENLIKSFQEIHRVLLPGSFLIVTLDEIWDCKKENKPDAFWSFLDLHLRNKKYVFKDGISFSIYDFVDLVNPYFKPLEVLNFPKGNASEELLHHSYYNDTVSFGVFKKS